MKDMASAQREPSQSHAVGNLEVQVDQDWHLVDHCQPQFACLLRAMPLAQATGGCKQVVQLQRTWDCRTYHCRETHKLSSSGNQQSHQSSDVTASICPAEAISRLLTWRKDRLCRRLFALLTSGNEGAGRCCFTRRLAERWRLCCTQLLDPPGAGRCLSAGAFRSSTFTHEPVLSEHHGLVGCFTLCIYTGWPRSAVFVHAAACRDTLY